MNIHPLDQALAHCQRGEFDLSYGMLKLIADDPRAQFNLGWHEMRRGNLKKGMEGMAVGRFGKVFGSPPLATDRPIWRDQSLKGKKVLLHGEGGYGDEIINVRFAKDFKQMGAYVTVSCARSLMSLFRTLDYVDALVARDQAVGADHDFWVPAMSAALVLDYEYADLRGIPYIPKPRCENRCDSGVKIGVKWSGNPQFEWEQHRKFDPQLMLGLADIANEIPGVCFYNLQRDEDRQNLPDTIFDMGPLMTDWLETARIVAGLDLVITSCTSIAHLAGAMGVECWVVVPICPYYIWALPGNASPWYHSVKLHRQTVPGSWDEPFAEIREKLLDFADA